MFDLNAIVNAAINAAVEARITEVLQQHANTVGALAERIAALEKNEEYLTNRIAALENNPAQGVDTSVVAGNYTPISNEQIKAALQEWAATGGFVTRDEVEALIEQAVYNHCETYDHDNYDEIASKVDDLPDLDDFVTRDSVREEIEDVLNNATLSLSI